MGNLKSHGKIRKKKYNLISVPWEINIPMGNFPWDFVKVPWEFVKVPWEKNNPMGKFNFPWEFSPLILIISPARCEQVKSKLVFDYAEPDLQHGGYGFSPCWS